MIKNKLHFVLIEITVMSMTRSRIRKYRKIKCFADKQTDRQLMIISGD